MTGGINQRGRYGRFVANLLSISDFAVVNLTYAVVLALNPEMLANHPRLLGLLLNVAYLPSAWTLREVRNVRAIHMDLIIFNSLRSVGIHALFFFSLLYFLDIDNVSWRGIGEFYGGIAILLPLWWVVSRLLLKNYRRRGRNFTRVVIVGTGPTAERLYQEMHSDAGFGYRFMGFFDYGYRADFSYEKLYIGNLAALDDYVREHHIDQIYYTLSGEDTEAISRSVKVADHNMAQFYFVPQMARVMTRAMEIDSIGTVPVMNMRANPLSSAFNRGVKRAMDIAISTIFLTVSPLIFIPVAVAIKTSSPGPIFFRQKRTGYKGKEFTCLKFRTMKVNATSDTAQASKTDPRTTRVGDFLRRTSIDELPQFINVLRGDMSVVGPRPHMLAHTDKYSKLIDKYIVRHLIKPGITGWAQVNGYRGQTGQLWQMERRVEFDVWYIENWSFLLDLKIVMRTIVNALHGEENAF